MSRLTQSIRGIIRTQAVHAAFKDREDVKRQREHELGMAAYEAVIPAAEREAAFAMPDGWLRKDSCLRFNANGWTGIFCVNPAVPVPSDRHFCHELGVLTGDLAEQAQEHLQAENKLMEDRSKASKELDGFLAQFKSIKQLREAWPEGEPFYAEFDVERKAGGVPAVRVAEINKLLNLKEAA